MLLSHSYSACLSGKSPSERRFCSVKAGFALGAGLEALVYPVILGRSLEDLALDEGVHAAGIGFRIVGGEVFPGRADAGYIALPAGQDLGDAGMDGGAGELAQAPAAPMQPPLPPPVQRVLAGKAKRLVALQVMARAKRSASITASSKEAYGRMRVPPTAGPSVVSWMAITARREDAASWRSTISSCPSAWAVARNVTGLPVSSASRSAWDDFPLRAQPRIRVIVLMSKVPR